MSNMEESSCHSCTCNIQYFAMHTCKHTPLAYYASTYSYLHSVERAYIAAQAEIVDILHKEQNLKKKKMSNNTQHKHQLLEDTNKYMIIILIVLIIINVNKNINNYNYIIYNYIIYNHNKFSNNNGLINISIV